MSQELIGFRIVIIPHEVMNHRAVPCPAGTTRKPARMLCSHNDSECFSFLANNEHRSLLLYLTGLYLAGRRII